MSRKTLVSRNIPVVHLKRNIFAKITDNTYLAATSNVGEFFGDGGITHSPGGVVIFGSQVSHSPLQYAWAWGTWNGSS